jgi:predicted enzyme related to lactoylglutathione lyase
MQISIRNIVFTCPDGTWTGERWEGPPRELALFYADLLGMRIMREDWLVVAKDRESLPRLAFDELADYRPPRWPDPEHPQQVHLDITVHDVDDAEARVLGSGATRLQDAGTFRTFADPAGHPFCLYPPPIDGGPDDAPRIERVVFDCDSPRALAAFYEGLTGFGTRVEDTPDRVVIARADGAVPMLAFQRAPGRVPPRWPDPAYPQQLHIDFDVDQGSVAVELAERLGATRLAEMGGSCPVFADPASHPFCLCAPDQ